MFKGSLEYLELQVSWSCSAEGESPKTLSWSARPTLFPTTSISFFMSPRVLSSLCSST